MYSLQTKNGIKEKTSSQNKYIIFLQVILQPPENYLHLIKWNSQAHLQGWMK